MIKTVIFSGFNSTELSQNINGWIEKKKEEDPYFKVKNVRYSPVVVNNITIDKVMIVYEEETEREKEKRYQIGMEMAKVFKGEKDAGTK